MTSEYQLWGLRYRAAFASAPLDVRSAPNSRKNFALPLFVAIGRQRVRNRAAPR